MGLLLCIPPHGTSTHQDEQDASPCIGTHHGSTHVGNAAKDVLSEGTIEIACIDILLYGCLVTGAEAIMSKSWCHHINQADDHRKDACRIQGFQVGLLHPYFQSPQGDEWYYKLHHHEDACHRAELGVHGHMIYKEIRERHKVLTPSEQQGQKTCRDECPLQGILMRNDEQAHHEEHAHQSTEINRTACAGLFTPILREGAIDAHLFQLSVSLLHGGLIHRERHACPTLHVGDEEGQRLVNAVTPRGDVTAFQTTVCLVIRLTLLHKFTLATHGVLGIFVGMIEVGNIETDGYHCCQGDTCRSLTK